MYNPFSLSGKTILITGASSGIGKAIAIECSRMGASVVITGRNENRLDATFTQLYGDGHLQFIADLLDFNSFSLFCSKLPKLDGVVNCAGLMQTGLYQYLSKDMLDSVMNTNFYSPFLLTQSLLKFKKISKGCSIVFISSISGVNISSIGNTAYSASKGAINGFMKNIAVELAPKRIRVNSINPGMVKTDFFSSGEITSEQLEKDSLRYPLKRYGKPEEIAYAAIYLLSDATSWMTGSNLVIDGGYTLL